MSEYLQITDGSSEHSIVPITFSNVRSGSNECFDLSVIKIMRHITGNFYTILPDIDITGFFKLYNPMVHGTLGDGIITKSLSRRTKFPCLSGEISSSSLIGDKDVITISIKTEIYNSGPTV